MLYIVRLLAFWTIVEGLRERLFFKPGVKADKHALYTLERILFYQLHE